MPATTAAPMPPGMARPSTRQAATRSSAPQPPVMVRLPRMAEGGSIEANFVQKYMPYAKAWEAKTGIPASVFLGIGASESNWGRAGSIFGIKGASPSGKSQSYATWEMVNGSPVQTTDTFAVYDDPNEGFQHFVNLVQNGRYAGAWQQFQKTGNASDLLRGINQAGYATDPDWWKKIGSLSTRVQSIATDTGADKLPAATPTTATTSTPSTSGSAPATTQTAGPTPPGTTPPGTTANSSGFQARPGADDALTGQYKAALDRLTALQQEYDDLNKTPNRTKEQDSRVLILSQALIPSARDDTLKLYAAINPGKTESPTQQALVQSQIQNNQVQQAKALQDMQTSLLGQWGTILHNSFGEQKDASQFVLDILNSSFTQAAQAYQANLNKGTLDLNGYVALVQAHATQQAAEAARAVDGLARAQFINKGNWEMERNKLPLGTAYQPGFGPDDPVNKMLGNLGLGQMIVRTAPVDWNRLDPVQNLATADRTQTDAGYQRPGDMGITDLAGQVGRNLAIPALGQKPVTVQSFQQAGGTLPTPQNYGDIIKQLKDNYGDLPGLIDQFTRPAVQYIDNTPAAGTGAGTATPPADGAPPATTPGSGVAETVTNTIGHQIQHAAGIVLDATTGRLTRAQPGEQVPWVPTPSTAPTGWTGTSPVVTAPLPQAGRQPTSAPTAPIDRSWIPDPTDSGFEINTATGDRRRKAGA